MCCQHQMERNEITTAEFEAIQQSFLEQVIVGKNIFYKSSPDEVQHFIKFVQKTGPYDVVIDGLNVLNNKRNPNAVCLSDLSSSSSFPFYPLLSVFPRI